ncbi:MAG: cytochrome C [Leptolyngbya sp. PLA3]|nr:MAG: cytochrome C [Cyanobacteria bacterium CYA]MCE7967271.1 cytochrome C [Leptolyngbya sp. PL-A3]
MIDRIVGPRVEPSELSQRTLRYGTPSFLLLTARVLLLVSLFLPYWHMTLHAPQYPDNLHLTAYINSLTGDVAEINGLNHYIGMRPLEEAAQFERSVGVYAMIAMVVLLELAAFIHTKWAALLVIPAILFPGVFLLDLHLWMSHFGQNLDPTAPLSNSIEPFVPPILGEGIIGQFKTVASGGLGFYLACAASVVQIVALYFHRRAYRPLVLAERASVES